MIENKPRAENRAREFTGTLRCSGRTMNRMFAAPLAMLSPLTGLCLLAGPSAAVARVLDART
jgi:hypothetical protein